MSPHRFGGVVLTCDQCKRAKVNHRVPGTEAELKAAVNAQAIRLGWTITDDRQICLLCTKREAN